MDVVLGAQYGREGKSKIIDFLSKDKDIFLRFNGGNNQEHLVVDNRKWQLHLIPSGIRKENSQVCLSSGVFIDPWILKEEIEILSHENIEVVNRIKVAFNSQLIMRYHRWLDKKEITRVGADGTLQPLQRGIAPAQIDKVSGSGLLMETFLLKNSDFIEILENAWLDKKPVLLDYGYDEQRIEKAQKEAINALLEMKDLISPFICDTYSYLQDNKDKNILAQGSISLQEDIDFNYPYSENYHAGISSLLTAGLSFKEIKEVVLVSKSFLTTREELDLPKLNKQEETLIKSFEGLDFPCATVSWLDCQKLKRVAQLNGASCLALTKLDILALLEDPKITDIKEERVTPFSRASRRQLEKARDYESLPLEAKQFIDKIEEKTEIPINYISTSKRKEDLIKRH